MNVKTYINRIPDKWIIKNSFLDLNPNLSYLLTYGNQSILIDANMSAEELTKDLNKFGSTLEWILLTHTHLDHSYRLPEILARHESARVGIHPRGAKNTFPDIKTDKFTELAPDTEIKLSDACLTVLFTPGHTNDSLCFWDKDHDLLFTGDTIIGGEIGTCDYHSGGKRIVFYQTIICLLQLLPEATKIFPGHLLNKYYIAPPYLLSEEIKNNLSLQYATSGNQAAFDKELKGLFKARMDLE
jgi:glyoxylase-like metal-dependent hydrolase (beta-lactamase superfamily II)